MTRGKGNYGKFQFNIKEKNTMRVVKHWARLPRNNVASPSLEILQTWQEVALGKMSPGHPLQPP